MSLQPQIISIPEKKLIGCSLNMNFANYAIATLWQKFLPRRMEISNTVNSDLISLAIYEPGFFEQFNPQKEFIRWAAVEVENIHTVPNGMESFVVPAGLYAVFYYKGLNTDNAVFQYIFGTWIPNSQYVLDNRPHFEVLGEKYKNNDPSSEEEIWIPIIPKK